MLGKLFNKKKADATQQQDADRAKTAFKHVLEEKRKTDPLIGAKLCADALINPLTDVMAKNDPKGVHIDTLIVAIASVGGFACQMAIREGLIKTCRVTEKQAFIELKGADGKTYYTGDLINDPLIAGKVSFYSYAGGGAQHAGAKKLPDFNELIGHVASTYGTERFGLPRYPEGHGTPDTPINWVKNLWPLHLPNLQFYCASPIEWPPAYGIALQKIITTWKEVIDPELAIQMAMEAAVPMSRIDYREIAGG